MARRLGRVGAARRRGTEARTVDGRRFRWLRRPGGCWLLIRCSVASGTRAVQYDGRRAAQSVCDTWLHGVQNMI